MALNLAAPTEIPGEIGPHGTKVVKPPPALDEIAKHFPQFEILECLGRGGMGVVYKARQPKLNRIVALKILAPEKVAEPKFAERFEREAQALARLNHPNIVTVYDFGETGGLYYLTMEFVDGVSLRQLLQTRKIMPEEALAIVPKICEALQFAHEQGVVHRDIKPENVLLDKRGRVKIADFGIAKIVGGTPLTPSDGERVAAKPGEKALTQDQVLGTPHYMAPEQVEHPQTVDHRADIYSLGVVFYEMLTGELPLGRFAPPSKKVQVDVRLDEVVLRALEKEPDRRYQHASEVKTDVETIAHTPGATPSAPALTAPGSSGVAAVWGQVKGPAIGLVVTGILNWVAIPLIVLVTAAVASQSAAHNYYVLFVPLAALVLSSVMIVAGLKMKRLEAYGLAITGSILAILITPGNVIGLPIGIWALVVLSHRQVREAFGKGYSHPLQATASAAPPTSRPDRFWRRFAVAVALVLLAMILIPVGSMLVAIAIPNFVRARQRAQAIAADSTRVVRVAEKLRQEIEKRLSEAHISFRSVSVTVSPGFGRADCLLDGLRKEVSPNLFEDFVGGLDIRPAGNALWSVKGKGGLGHVSFTVDTSAAMKPMPALDESEWGPVIDGDPNPQPRAALAAAFSPAREVTLTEFNNRDGQEALDLDTGTVFKQPKDMDQWSEEGLAQWVKENGIDLFVDHGPGGVWGLLTTTNAELKLARVGNDKWGAISEGELVRVLSGGATALQIVTQGKMKVYLPPKETQPPMTFAFKTSSGGVGLLQITGFADNPRGVKLRYKLTPVEAATQSPAEAAQNSVMFHPATNGTAALNAARDFVLEHQWKLLSEGGNNELVTMRALDADGKRVTFEEAAQAGGMARFTVSTEPGAQMPAHRIRSELWHRLGWGNLGDPSSSDGTNRLSFGPVIERVVTNMIDFDSGALVDLPLPTQPGERDPERYDWINGEGVPWMRAQGCDAMNANHGLIGVDLLVVPLESKDWHGLTPAGLRSKLDGLQLPKAPSSSSIPQERRPFGFQTREGALGIFEITDANLRRGVKLRYKLVK